MEDPERRPKRPLELGQDEKSAVEQVAEPGETSVTKKTKREIAYRSDLLMLPEFPPGGRADWQYAVAGFEIELRKALQMPRETRYLAPHFSALKFGTIPAMRFFFVFMNKLPVLYGDKQYARYIALAKAWYAVMQRWCARSMWWQDAQNLSKLAKSTPDGAKRIFLERQSAVVSKFPYGSAPYATPKIQEWNNVILTYDNILNKDLGALDQFFVPPSFSSVADPSVCALAPTGLEHVAVRMKKGFPSSSAAEAFAGLRNDAKDRGELADAVARLSRATKRIVQTKESARSPFSNALSFGDVLMGYDLPEVLFGLKRFQLVSGGPQMPALQDALADGEGKTRLDPSSPVLKTWAGRAKHAVERKWTPSSLDDMQELLTVDPRDTLEEKDAKAKEGLIEIPAFTIDTGFNAFKDLLRGLLRKFDFGRATAMEQALFEVYLAHDSVEKGSYQEPIGLTTNLVKDVLPSITDYLGGNGRTRAELVPTTWLSAWQSGANKRFT